MQRVKACTPRCVATTSVEYVQWGWLCSSLWRRSHGLEHGIIDLCQGQLPGPSSDKGTNKAIWRVRRSACGIDWAKKKLALVDLGAMVCTVGLNMFGDLGLQ